MGLKMLILTTLCACTVLAAAIRHTKNAITDTFFIIKLDLVFS